MIGRNSIEKNSKKLSERSAKNFAWKFLTITEKSQKAEKNSLQDFAWKFLTITEKS